MRPSSPNGNLVAVPAGVIDSILRRLEQLEQQAAPPSGEELTPQNTAVQVTAAGQIVNRLPLLAQDAAIGQTGTFIQWVDAGDGSVVANIIGQRFSQSGNTFDQAFIYGQAGPFQASSTVIGALDDLGTLQSAISVYQLGRGAGSTTFNAVYAQLKAGTVARLILDSAGESDYLQDANILSEINARGVLATVGALANLNVVRGNATLTWPGGTNLSNPQTINPTFSDPSATIGSVVTGSSDGDAVIQAAIIGPANTSFLLRGNWIGGTNPPAGTTVPASWLAIA